MFDPSDPDFIRDPYPTYARLRAEEPLHRSASGAWVLTRYADVRRALEDPRLGNAPARYAVVAARNRERYVCADVAGNILPFVDPPVHDAPRRIIGRAFSARLRATPPDVLGTARRIVADCPTGPFDVLADFATPLARGIVSEVLGVPAGMRPGFAACSADFFRLFAPITSREVRDRLDGSLTEFRAGMADLVRERRRRPADDLVSDLCEQVGGDFSEAQLVDNLMLLFADGLENVDRAIANAVSTLLSREGAWARLADDPRLRASAVDECLRFESPAQFTTRIVREPVAFHGTELAPGSAVLLVLGSANRDEDAFADADTFDLARTPNPHLAFGRGRHSCIGGPLVERQMRDALRVLVEELPGLRLLERSAEWSARPAHRWIERVVVDRGAASP